MHHALRDSSASVDDLRFNCDKSRSIVAKQRFKSLIATSSRSIINYPLDPQGRFRSGAEKELSTNHVCEKYFHTDANKDDTAQQLRTQPTANACTEAYAKQVAQYAEKE